MPVRSSQQLRDNVGQLMIMGFDGTAVDQRLRAMLTTLQPGGVILFRRNIETAIQTHALLRDAQRALGVSIFRCVDMEGGTVDRFRDVAGCVPSALDVARTGSELLYRKHGALIGRQLRAMGFNTDFAPCLDLGLEASRKALGSRTISADPEEVVKYAREFLRGLRKERLLGCAKHFPGLGGGAVDSHLGLPEVSRTWKQAWDEDLLPYRALRRDVAFVMVAHVAYPKIMKNRGPASLSRGWIEGVLREKIGYRGLVISDDLDMGGVLNGASIENAAVGTLEAGCDMFLVCQKEEHVWRAYEAVLRRCEQHKGFARIVGTKARRVRAFKDRSLEIQARLAPAPSAKAVETMRRNVWEFTEEVRLSALATRERVPR
jgi:beta-N-acetylhexosaminidase